MRKTGIICTIGPASWDPLVFQNMVDAGMNIARVNGAFADVNELDKVNTLGRNVQSELKLMMDVKGPEARMNKFPSPITLYKGMEIIIGSTQNSEIYTANYPNFYQTVQSGQRIIVGDGEAEFLVKNVQDDKVVAEVVYGEVLNPGKALNLPGTQLSASILTQRDLENLRHSIQIGWEYVSASYIQSADAARKVRSVIANAQMQLFAKIEDQAGLDNIDTILPEVDGIMVARGGLGVELGLEKVPAAQKYLIQKAKAANKPSIVATQMLESMAKNPRPTRAEVNDVATAVYQGADYVMLSGETSTGKYPVEAVTWMAKIIDETERQQDAPAQPITQSPAEIQ